MLTNSKLSPLAVAIAMASISSNAAALCADTSAQTFEVTSASDTTADDDVITLREAVTLATASNCNSDPDTITFNDSIAGQTIALDTIEAGTLSIAGGHKVAIKAGPEQDITITRNKQSVQMFYISGGELELENLVLDNESKGGAQNFIGIDGSGNLSTTDTDMINNVTDYGGAIHVTESGSVDINGGSFTNNQAYEGAAILADVNTNLTIKDAEFKSNNASYGGAIKLESNTGLTLEGSTFESNSATDGGAILAEGATTIHINDSVFDGNSADQSGALHLENSGGAIDYQIEDSKFENNSSKYKGGAVQYYHNSESGSALTIRRSQFVNNEANKDYEGHQGGAVYIRGNYMVAVETTVEDSTFTGNKAYGGSGIAVNADRIQATLKVTNSTFNGNQTGYHGGAIWMRAQESGTIGLSLINSTLSDNSASGYDGQGGGYGGAISLWNAEDNTGLDVIHSTIVNNTASFGGGLYASAQNISAPIAIKNSLIGANTATEDHRTIGHDVLTEDTAGTVASFENSVIGDAGGAADAENSWENKDNSSLIGNDGTDGNDAVLDVSNMIGPLQDNGGTTLTHYPLSASLIDQGADLTEEVSTDQRGVERSDGSPDIGAIEDSSSALVWSAFTDIDQLAIETGVAVNIDLNNYISDSDKYALTYSADNLPAGINLSTAGLLTGAFESADSFVLIFTVADNFGGSSQSPQLTINVSEPVAPEEATEEEAPSNDEEPTNQEENNSDTSNDSSSSAGTFSWTFLIGLLLPAFRRRR